VDFVAFAATGKTFPEPQAVTLENRKTIPAVFVKRTLCGFLRVLAVATPRHKLRQRQSRFQSLRVSSHGQPCVYEA